MRRRNATKSGAVWRLGLILVLSAVLWPQSLHAEAPIGRFVIGVWSPAGWSGAAKGGVAYHSYDRFFTQSDADSLAELGVNLLIQTPRVGNKDIDDFRTANPGSKKQDAHEILQDLEEAIIRLSGCLGWIPKTTACPPRKLFDFPVYDLPRSPWLDSENERG